MVAACSVSLAWVGEVRCADQTLPPVVVTASRVPTPLSQSLASVTVIEREEIERQGASDVVSLLRSQVGIEVGQTGGPGSTAAVFMRGADSRFTAVLIDGVRVDSQATGGASWAGIPLAIVDRIEIVRGPLSAVYGSDAVAGVIQIFTRKGSGSPTVTLGAGLGSRSTYKVDASVIGGTGAFDYALAMATQRSHGFNAITNPSNYLYGPDDDGHRTSNANARLGWQLNSDHRVEVSSVYSQTNAQYDAGPPAADDHSFIDLKTSRALWSARWTDQWRSQMQVAQSIEMYRTEPQYSNTQTHIRTGSWQNDWQSGEHGLHLTAERREDSLVNDSTAYSARLDSKRSQNGLAGGYDWRSQTYGIQLNARTDDDSEFGRHDTGALAAGWQFTDAWRLRASIGTSFRAPTLYQRFSEFGNANLTPEKALNRELGLKYEHAGYTFDAAVFHNKLTNLIDFVVTQYQNTGRAVLQGLSTTAGMPIGNWRLSGTVDLQSPKNVDTGDLLVRRARQHFNAQLDGPLLGWTVGAQVQASAHREDLSYDASFNTVRVRLPGYAVLNLTAQRDLVPGLGVLLRVDNVFDREYQTVVDYRANLRTVFIGMKWTISR